MFLSYNVKHMRYKAIYHFQWLLALFLIIIIYLSTMLLIQLPFIRIKFHEISFAGDLSSFFTNLLPTFSTELQSYNLQVFIVWLTGIILGSRRSCLALMIYLLIGFLGFPVFSGGGGFDYYQEPTFGYLVSLPINAFLSGYLYEKNKKLLAVFTPIFLTHASGIIYLLIFKTEWINIGWFLSFSMIGYDLLFCLLALPILPLLIFLIRELFTYEVPVRERFVQSRI